MQTRISQQKYTDMELKVLSFSLLATWASIMAGEIYKDYLTLISNRSPGIAYYNAIQENFPLSML